MRNLVHRSFTPRALRKLEGRIEELTHELLDKAPKRQEIDLFERPPNIRLAVPPEALTIQKIPGWHRRESLPVVLA